MSEVIDEFGLLEDEDRPLGGRITIEATNVQDDGQYTLALTTEGLSFPMMLHLLAAAYDEFLIQGTAAGYNFCTCDEDCQECDDDE